MDTSSPPAPAEPPPAEPLPASGASRAIMFLKAPRPGQVKTRIAAALDADAAAAIYRVLIERTLAALRPFTDVELRLTPFEAESQTEVRRWLRPGWRLSDQGDGSLGDRLQRAISDACDSGVSRLVIVGSDCPGLESDDIQAAYDGLKDSDVVIGPAVDGGYWLIAVRRPEPTLFQDIPWSTPQVFTTTLDRARTARLRVRVLRELRDIDTLEDWRTWLRPKGRP